MGVPVTVNILGALTIICSLKLKFEPLDSLPSREKVVPEVKPVITISVPLKVEVTTVLEIAELKSESKSIAVYAVVEEAWNARGGFYSEEA